MDMFTCGHASRIVHMSSLVSFCIFVLCACTSETCRDHEWTVGSIKVGVSHNDAYIFTHIHAHTHTHTHTYSHVHMHARKHAYVVSHLHDGDVSTVGM